MDWLVFGIATGIALAFFAWGLWYQRRFVDAGLAAYAPTPPRSIQSPPPAANAAHGSLLHPSPVRRITVVNLASLVQTTPHIAVLGDTGSGKTWMAEALVRLLDGKVAILDPKWRAGKWGNLHAIPIDDEGAYSLISAALRTLWGEFRSRIVAQKQDSKARHEPLWIVWDEINDLMEEDKQAGTYLRRWLRLGREYNVHVMFFPQSDRVEALGLSGHGDARKNVLWIYLGDDARAVVNRLSRDKAVSGEYAAAFCRQAFPALVEFRGEWIAVDRSAVPEILTWPVAPDRAWFSGSEFQSSEVPVRSERENNPQNLELLELPPIEPSSDDERTAIVAMLQAGLTKTKTAKLLTGNYQANLRKVQAVVDE